MLTEAWRRYPLLRLRFAFLWTISGQFFFFHKKLFLGIKTSVSAGYKNIRFAEFFRKIRHHFIERIDHIHSKADCIIRYCIIPCYMVKNKLNIFSVKTAGEILIYKNKRPFINFISFLSYSCHIFQNCFIS